MIVNNEEDFLPLQPPPPINEDEDVKEQELPNENDS
jgi:hypothetical protein